MFYFFFGPLVLIAGLCMVYLGIHGVPQRGVPASRLHPSRPSFGREDQLMGEVLTEMLGLRKELARIKAEATIVRPLISPPR